MIELKDIIAFVAFVIGFPISFWAIYRLVRFWKSMLRKERKEFSDTEKEKAYLYAFLAFLEELDRPIGYNEDEYTALKGLLVEEETISLRFLFRQATSNDQIGLIPRDIVSTENGRHIGDIYNLLVTHKEPIIVLGEPGSGKSVTLRNMALRITRQQIEKDPIWPIIPIYLQLGAYNQSDENGNPIDVLGFIKEQLRGVIPGGHNIVESIESVLRERRAVILLDAMDEMPAKDFPQRSIKIKNFMMEFGKTNKIIVACRQREYTGELPHSELIIRGFDIKKIREYLDKSWNLYHKHFLSPQERYTSYGKYIEISQKKHPLFDFASNPFFLKLLTRYFFTHGGTLPTSQAEILGSYINEKIQRESQRSDFSVKEQDLILLILSAFSYGVIEGQLGTYIKLRDSITKIKSLQSYAEKEVDDAISTGIKCGLIRKEVDNSIRFEHHRILEYLAAQYWEKSRIAEQIKPMHLKNPWWRETLVLRAGVTNEPNKLINKIIEVTPLFKGSKDNNHAQSIGYLFELEQLERLVSFEVVVLCAKQRWGELNTKTRSSVMFLSNKIAEFGSVLEQVRLIRSMSGLPIDFSYDVFSVLAKSKSDWVINELFSSINPEDYTSEYFNKLIQVFFTKSGVNLFGRITSITGMPLHIILKQILKLPRKILLQTIFSLLLYWGLIFGLFWLGNSYVGKNVYSADKLSLNTILTVIAFTSVFMLIWGGWKLTITALILYGLFNLVFPPLTSIRYFLVLYMYIAGVGEEFHRAKWIKNSILRAFLLYRQIPGFLRICISFTFWWSTTVLAYYFLSNGQTVPYQIHSRGGILLTLISEIVFALSCYRVIKRLQKYESSINEAKAEILLKECLLELSRPWPKHISNRILDQITNLPVDENILIEKLKNAADKNEFFVTTEKMIEAIDRLDTRRRQKYLVIKDSSM